MIFFADLHVHSRYSRATSRNGNLVELARWAALKGVQVVATGDFTHPAWRQEIHEMLVEAETGLFRLKPGFRPPNMPGASTSINPDEVLFMLNVEISSIYKVDGQVRKVHSLVFAPDFQTMDLLSSKLDRIGNIASDGRPILGLDARNLLELSLESSPDCFIIPAHVWTPWFSVLGSKSGFESVEECYRDLTPHIFAIETGLSSDPAMNYRLSSLDRYTLVSNSDTHSPSRLGREANIFIGQPSYWSILEAIRNGSRLEEDITQEVISDWYMHQSVSTHGVSDRFLGTVEFFPEEGKYHLDGHRKCGVRLDPRETDQLGERCPMCGRSVTVGVMNRVNQLADRDPEFMPGSRPPFWRMLPLEQILAQIVGTGPNSKRVQTLYMEMIGCLGPELPLLCFCPLDYISRQAPPIFVEALRRVRNAEVTIKPGYDGQYGTVELFSPGEVDRLSGQNGIFGLTKIGKTPKPSFPKSVSDARPQPMSLTTELS